MSIATFAVRAGIGCLVIHIRRPQGLDLLVGKCFHLEFWCLGKMTRLRRAAETLFLNYIHGNMGITRQVESRLAS